MSGLASNLIGKKVTLPTITSAEPPKEAIDRLSKALGVQLPSDYGQITLVRSNNLAVAQRGVKAFDRLTILLPLVTLALIAFTLWLSVSRRRTLVQLLVGHLAAADRAPACRDPRAECAGQRRQQPPGGPDGPRPTSCTDSSS